MFIAVPLETKPSWRAPPWMTLLLIALNCLVFFGWQLPEERAVNKAAAAYAKTPLAASFKSLFCTRAETSASRTCASVLTGRAAALAASGSGSRSRSISSAPWCWYIT